MATAKGDGKSTTSTQRPRRFTSTSRDTCSARRSIRTALDQFHSYYVVTTWCPERPGRGPRQARAPPRDGPARAPPPCPIDSEFLRRDATGSPLGRRLPFEHARLGIRQRERH